MVSMTKKRSSKAGLPPGSLVHIGEKKTEEVEITVFSFNESGLEEKEIKLVEECFIYKEKENKTWINVEGIHKVDVLEKLGTCFNIHPLALEDILNTDQRPKIEDFGDTIYIVLKMLSLSQNSFNIVTEQVSIILGQNFVISFQEGIKGDVFNPLRERLRVNKGKIRKSGADYLAYSLMDAIVDSYFLILERLGERIECIEDELIQKTTSKTIKEIHTLKREVLFLRKSVWPLREVINNLQREDSNLINESIKIYLRDIYDHTIQIIDTIETFRDMLSGMLEIYLSSTNNRINEAMRTLTIIATIFMPPTFIAGIYGMNFKYLPELDWHWGYPFALLLMLITTISMLVYVKNKKWI